MRLFDLPHIALDKVLSYLSYDEVAKLRIVCKQFDHICKQRLNKGFAMAERYHAQCLKAVKLQLPRRESERRSHPLSRHNEVLMAVETRLSMLSMTYVKFIDLGMCCFIPGKVIDEIFKILHHTQHSKSLPRSLEVLQELRDISSMAMEHFDEKILPFIRDKLTHVDPTPRLLSGTPPSISKVLEKVRGLESDQLVSCSNSHLEGCNHSYTTVNHNFSVTSQIKHNKNEVDKLKEANKKLSLKVRRQQKQLTIQATRLHELDAHVTELRRTVEELQHRCGDVSAEISRAREEPAAAVTIDLPSPARKRRKCSLDAQPNNSSKVPRK